MSKEEDDGIGELVSFGKASDDPFGTGGGGGPKVSGQAAARTKGPPIGRLVVHTIYYSWVVWVLCSASVPRLAAVQHTSGAAGCITSARLAAIHVVVRRWGRWQSRDKKYMRFGCTAVSQLSARRRCCASLTSLSLRRFTSAFSSGTGASPSPWSRDSTRSSIRRRS